jgi:hypothetical protein
MSDNLTRYLAISTALQQGYRQAYAIEPAGNYQRHLNTLSAMIGGIVGSQKTRLSAIANKMPGKVQRESRIKRLSRWIKNERVTREAFFVPFVTTMLQKFSRGPLVLVVDGSDVGHGCVALVVSVLFQKRALPLGWLVVAGKKGHFSQENHVRIVEQVAPLIPEGREVIFLGDGEFDGCELLDTVQKKGWKFACRTARNVVLTEQEDIFSFDDLAVAPGELLSVPEVAFTAQGFGPVTAIAHWHENYEEPLYLVTNLELADEAVYWYRKRYGIETFFSDLKSRGFYLCHSHVSEPDRISRLLIAASLAYIWIVYMGAIVCRKPSWLKRIHRTHRRDLSLFQLGIAWIEECLNRAETIPVAFVMPKAKCVRW